MDRGDGYRKGVGIAFRLGTELIVATFLGSVMGYALDYKFDSSPWFLIVGVFMGGAAGCLNAYRVFQEVVKENNKDNE
ncbi:MAG: AtpZ/AtpI family protein [Desulfovibrio sp.]|nr:AtpZ/AtpI family protein [Desulfovibrio sp.]